MSLWVWVGEIQVQGYTDQKKVPKIDVNINNIHIIIIIIIMNIWYA